MLVLGGVKLSEQEEIVGELLPRVPPASPPPTPPPPSHLSPTKEGTNKNIVFD